VMGALNNSRLISTVSPLRLKIRVGMETIPHNTCRPGCLICLVEKHPAMLPVPQRCHSGPANRAIHTGMSHPAPRLPFHLRRLMWF